MERQTKKRKKLILIGIVCDDEIKDTIDLKPVKDRSKMVKIILFYVFILFDFKIGCKNATTETRSVIIK